MYQDEKDRTILQLINDKIAQHSAAFDSEARHPHGCADTMDDILKRNRECVQKLRRIREELEELFYGKVK